MDAARGRAQAELAEQSAALRGAEARRAPPAEKSSVFLDSCSVALCIAPRTSAKRQVHSGLDSHKNWFRRFNSCLIRMCLFICVFHERVAVAKVFVGFCSFFSLVDRASVFLAFPVLVGPLVVLMPCRH